MRKLQSPVATALAIGLLATPAIGADTPSDEADAAAVAVAFTGIVDGLPTTRRSGAAQTVDGVVQRRGQTYEFELDLEHVSDARLSGHMIRSFEDDEYPGSEGSDSFYIQTMTIRIENDGGAWQGSRHYFGDDYDSEDRQVDSIIVLVGEDDYKGLYAAFDDSADFREFGGVIFPAPPPSPPTTP
jgi:hypothetical protein